jgi:small GTP-binding protein
MKIVLFGDTNVGKTCLVSRWKESTYNLYELPTIGVAFNEYNVQINGGTRMVQIWDTAGQERYESMASIYSRGANGVLLVFAVTTRDSLASIERWQKHIEYCDPKVRVIVVGNKIDAEREVTTEQGQAMADKLGYDYRETSALTGDGVVDAFMHLMEQIVDVQPTEVQTQDLSGSTGKKKKDCC